MATLTTGRPRIKTSSPSHVRGVYEGNQTGSLRRQKGIHPRGESAVASARRSTGIRPDDREPIDSRMPKLTPP